MLPVYLTAFFVAWGVLYGVLEQRVDPRNDWLSVWGQNTPHWVVYPIQSLLFFGIVTSAIVFGCSWSVYSDTCGEMRQESEATMVALADNSSVYGSFFLGTGTLDKTMVYVYYTKEGDGVYQFRTVDAHRAEVHEVDGVQPHVETWERHFKAPGADHIMWQSLYLDRYKFYIPPGTLRQNMTIDLQ